MVQKSHKNMDFKMGSKGSNVIFVKKYLLLIAGKQMKKYGTFTLKQANLYSISTTRRMFYSNYSTNY